MSYPSCNSRGFLWFYLALVAVLLVPLFAGWSERHAQWGSADSTEQQLVGVPMPQGLYSLRTTLPQLESDWQGQWTWLVMAYPECGADCDSVFQVLRNLRARFADRQIQFVVVDIRAVPTQQYDDAWLHNEAWVSDVVSGPSAVLDQWSMALGGAFVEFINAQGLRERLQRHQIFLINPDGELMTTFSPPFTSLSLQQQFLSVRDYWARSNGGSASATVNN